MVQAAHATDLRILEKMGQSESGVGLAFCTLQFLSDSRLTEDAASNGSGNYGSCLGYSSVSGVALASKEVMSRLDTEAFQCSSKNTTGWEPSS
jgi:hypothetical protein